MIITYLLLRRVRIQHVCPQGDTLTRDVVPVYGHLTVSNAEACLRGEGNAANYWSSGAYMPGAAVVADKLSKLVRKTKFQEVRIRTQRC